MDVQHTPKRVRRYSPITPPPSTLWESIGDTTAVLWRRDPETMEYALDGLVLYGPIDRQRLTEINLRQITDSPALDDVAHLNGRKRFAWISEESAPTPAQVRALDEALPVRDPDPARLGFEPRKENEPTDDFYKRVAAHYVVLQASAPGRPLKALAAAAGVEHHTAVYWVNQARQRGFLPRSSRQYKGDAR